MPEIAINDAINAAQDLVRLYNNNPHTPPQSHSVWVKTELGDGKQFVRSICVSEHPKFKGKLAIPAEHMGVPVLLVAWPRTQRE